MLDATSSLIGSHKITISPHDYMVGDYFAGKRNSDFAIVWVHGFGSHRGGEKAEAIREECRHRQWAFAAFDFRGHGESSGEMRELRASRLLEDLEAVRGFLEARGHSRLGLIGSSMGGFASAWFAARNPAQVLGCVLIAPAFRFLQRRWESLTEEQRTQWQRTDSLEVQSAWVKAELGYGFAEERDAFQMDALAARWATPALIFHGMADDIVPVSNSLDFLMSTDYSGIEVRVFKDGDHRLTAYKEEIANEAARFFTRWVG